MGKIDYNEFVNNIASDIREKIRNGAGQWFDSFERGGSYDFPANVRGNHYKGVNLMHLFVQQQLNGYKANHWLTFNQVSQKGGKVLKGEKGHTVFCFKPCQKTVTAQTSGIHQVVENGKIVRKHLEKGQQYVKQWAYARAYKVFNLTQTTLAETDLEQPVSKDLADLINEHQPDIQHHKQGQAYYNPNYDQIRLPEPTYFHTEDDYQATLLHELCHWTGQSNRLNRLKGQPSLAEYAWEELVAEISCTVMLKHLGITGTVRNHESYIESWFKNLEEKDFTTAVQASVKVISYLLNEGTAENNKAA